MCVLSVFIPLPPFMRGGASQTGTVREPADETVCRKRAACTVRAALITAHARVGICGRRPLGYDKRTPVFSVHIIALLLPFEFFAQSKTGGAPRCGKRPLLGN